MAVVDVLPTPTPASVKISDKKLAIKGRHIISCFFPYPLIRLLDSLLNDGKNEMEKKGGFSAKIDNVNNTYPLMTANSGSQILPADTTISDKLLYFCGSQVSRSSVHSCNMFNMGNT